MPSFIFPPSFTAAHFERVVKQFVEPAWQEVAEAIYPVIITSCRELPEAECKMPIGAGRQRLESRRVLQVDGQWAGPGRGMATVLLNPEVTRAILNRNACEAAPKIMGPIVEKVFRDYANVEVLTMPVRPRLVVQFPHDKDQGSYLHCVFKVTFRNSEVWFLDLTYTQFGFESCWAPQREYRGLYQNWVFDKDQDFCRPLDANYKMYGNLPADDRQLNDLLRESLRAEFSRFRRERGKNIHQMVDNGQELRALFRELRRCADEVVADLAHG
ncbi:uncharacterized protein BDZ99DRAFT_479932 [Mytilinidion resinicola]|uniref:Uncharacterized protein n=1 Tax=Mytilinidion resinicola TaxID=574789 RepID=A0A6A6YB31_9PEZI|nr:uncharacterized protein BDZ99DRAFT_479932 [Mytilinidion resinicola]KAF2805910.1 hypothetical protein BDZ99DRAFT_479932 [Mytilinidion resinicola]